MAHGGSRAGSGRKPGFRHNQVTRERIRTVKILTRLQNFALGLGEVHLSSRQVRTAIGLLRKTLPDLAAIAHTGAVELSRPETLTDEELERIIRGEIVDESGRPPTDPPSDPDITPGERKPGTTDVHVRASKRLS